VCTSPWYRRYDLGCPVALDVAAGLLFVEPLAVALLLRLIELIWRQRVILVSLKNLDDVIAKLAFDRFVYLADGRAESDILELSDHLTTTEPAEIATILGRSCVSRHFFGDCRKVLTRPPDVDRPSELLLQSPPGCAAR